MSRLLVDRTAGLLPIFFAGGVAPGCGAKACKRHFAALLQRPPPREHAAESPPGPAAAAAPPALFSTTSLETSTYRHRLRRRKESLPSITQTQCLTPQGGAFGPRSARRAPPANKANIISTRRVRRPSVVTVQSDDDDVGVPTEIFGVRVVFDTRRIPSTKERRVRCPNDSQDAVFTGLWLCGKTSVGSGRRRLSSRYGSQLLATHLPRITKRTNESLIRRRYKRYLS